MGLYIRAGLLVKFFGFLLFSVLGLTLCSTPFVFAQTSNSSSASIKAPKNLKKTANNKSDTTNKEVKSENDKATDKSSEQTSDNKEDKSEENKSNATSNGTPFGAWIPRDRVLWEHPESNNSANIKQSSNTSKPKITPVEKTKNTSIDPIRKTSNIKSTNKISSNKSKNTSTHVKLNKAKTEKPVKTTRNSSRNNSSKTVISTKSQPEDLITQEEPIDSTITESEGSNLPDEKTIPSNINKNLQPSDNTEVNGKDTNQTSSTIIPESANSNDNVISEPPSDSFDSSSLEGSKENTKVDSSTEPGIDESTTLEEDPSTIDTKNDNKLSAYNMGDVLRAIGSLLLVLAAITLLWFLSKLIMGNRDGSGFTQKTKLLHQMDLGMNQKLKLVQSGNMVLVLGVSPTGVQLFDKFPIDELDSHDWSSAVTSKTITKHDDIHFAPSEAPRKPRVTTKPNPEQAQTTLRNAAGAYSEAANTNSKGKSFTFRGGRLIERNEITDHTISQTPAQEKLISQIRSKVKQWDL